MRQTSQQPLTLSSFARAIIHIDGDAFFASCEQSRDPKLRGRPVITGSERGIAASLSYEAKHAGVTRGMRLSEIKRVCPNVVMLPSDYETYSILSRRFFNIVRRYTPTVEEYSIDECFADITGLQRPLHMSYEKIAQKIKEDLDRQLGFTFSVGLAPSKTLAKIGSKWKKPSGLTVIPGYAIHTFLAVLPVGDVWGIGDQTTAFLEKYGITTALDFATKDESWIDHFLTKPHKESWQELTGIAVKKLATEEKSRFGSIQKVKTFTPASSDQRFVLAQLSKNVENACMKARRYNLEAPEIIFFLKTQQFRYYGRRLRFSRATAFAHEMIDAITPLFQELFDTRHEYRATGVCLMNLRDFKHDQMDLFGEHLVIEKAQKIYTAVDTLRRKYGKHAVYLGTSHPAHKNAQHSGARGSEPERKRKLFKGETKRRRLAIPMFFGEVH